MHIARRPLALRSSVLAASVAVLASFVVAPSASAEETTAPTTSSSSPSGTPEAPPAEATPEPTPPATPSEVVPAEPSSTVDTGDTVVGELVQAWPEHEDAHEAEHGDEGPLTFIEQSDGSSVRVPTEDVEDVPVGATVEVTVGDEVVDAPAEDDGLLAAREVLEASVVAPAPATPAVAAAGTAVTNSVTIVRVVPAGGQPDSMSVATLTNAVNGPVADFWRTQSRGRIQLGTTTGPTGWVTSGASCSDPTGLWNSAAAAAGWVAGPNKHLLVYVSSSPQDLPGCSYGLAQVGSSATSGGRLYVRAAGTSVIAHELGHNFGLGHSSQVQCDGTIETGTCQVSAYRDFYDVMGASWNQLGSLNSPQADRLGVLPPADVVSLAATDPSRSVALSPVSVPSGTRAIRLDASDGAVYWLEYRTPSGQDSWLGTSANVFQLQSGVTLRRSSAGNDTSLAFDGTPSAPAAWAADRSSALPLSTTVAVAGGQFRVRVDRVDGTALVDVTTTVAPAPVPDQASAAVRARALAAGGDTGPLGPATGPVTCGLVSGGCREVHANGIVTWSAATGAVVVHGAIAQVWSSVSAEAGDLGLPLSEMSCGLAAGGCGQFFQGGRVLWSPATGSWAVSGAILGSFTSRGGEGGTVGYPTGAMTCGMAAGGCRQSFQGGLVVWSGPSGTGFVPTRLVAAWQSAGADAGDLGYPRSDLQCSASGCAQQFAGGSIVSTGRGTWSVSGAIGAVWSSRGGADGVLGSPTGVMVCGLVSQGCKQPFEQGVVMWSAATGPRFVHGGIAGAWNAVGAEAGDLGYPTREMTCALAQGGCRQDFQGGVMAWSPSTPARAVSGAIRWAWEQRGAQEGPIGYPTAPMTCDRSACRQEFTGGALVWTPSGGTVLVRR